MTYLAVRKTGRSFSFKLALAFIVIIVLGTVGLNYFLPNFLPNLFGSIARPFWQAQFSIRNGGLLSREDLLRENLELRQTIAAHDISLAAVFATELENQELKNLFGRASTTPAILAAVIMTPPASLYDELIIDLGRDSGLKKGDKVYASGGLAIGEVIEIMSQSAKVSLYSSPGNKLEVLIGSNNLAATATGQGGGQFLAELPQGAPIEVGEQVVAPSIDSRPLGQVASVVSGPAETFKRVLFALPINIYQIRWVLVEKK
ncbi:MAG: rod shape-determining protein MreC [Candidatus Paceibacterota bacterium]|jgi:cell shape-determining protein MreC